MAYKFQLGAARLSGSTTFEEPLVGEQSISAASLSASAGLEIGGTVRLDGIVDATAADADKLLFRDSDNLIKAETVANVRDLYFADISGQATVAAGGALSLAAAAITGQTEKTGDVADADELMVADAGGLKRLDFSVLRDAVFNDVSGDATVAAGGALTIAADSVEGTMLNTNAADGTTMELSSDSLSVLKVPNAVTGGAGISAFSFDGSGTATVALSASVAGDGLAFSAGVLSVGVDDSGIEINSDALRLKDNGVSLAKMAGITRGSIISGDASGDPQYLALGSDAQMLISDGSDLGYVSVSGDITITNAGVTAIGATKVTDAMLNDDVATGLAGDGLAASSGVLAVQVSGALKIASDKLGLSGSFAGDGIKFLGGADSISAIELDLNELPAAAVAVGADSFAFVDADDNTSKKESIADLMTAVAGDGLAASSGVLAVGAETNGGIAVLADGVKMDLSDLSAAAVDASADSIAILDATDSSTKLESIADLMTAVAGAGLTATSGVLSVTGNNVALKADGDTLAEGYNYFADVAAAATVTLPAGPAVGDVVVVKARAGVSATNYIAISRAGSQTIDGETQVRIESPFGAVSMVYVASNDWRII